MSKYHGAVCGAWIIIYNVTGRLGRLHLWNSLIEPRPTHSSRVLRTGVPRTQNTALFTFNVSSIRYLDNAGWNINCCVKQKCYISHYTAHFSQSNIHMSKCSFRYFDVTYGICTWRQKILKVMNQVTCQRLLRIFTDTLPCDVQCDTGASSQ